MNCTDLCSSKNTVKFGTMEFLSRMYYLPEKLFFKRNVKMLISKR